MELPAVVLGASEADAEPGSPAPRLYSSVSVVVVKAGAEIGVVGLGAGRQEQVQGKTYKYIPR